MKKINPLWKKKSQKIKKGQKFKIFSNGQSHIVDDIGLFSPKKISKKELSSGEVGFLVAGIKDIKGAPVGDTILEFNDEAKKIALNFAPSK